MSHKTLLLDYHGVISDGDRLPEQWRTLLGEFFVPRFGGDPRAWGRANNKALARSLERARQISPTTDQEEARRLDRIEWLHDMFQEVGIAGPSGEDADAVALEAIEYVIPRTNATVLGAASVLRTLHERGYVLYTASGDHSSSIDGYLRGLGVRDLFHETYGPNLFGVPKTGPRFYEALLAHAGVKAADAIAIDDDSTRLDWAAGLGVGTVLVSRDQSPTAHQRVGTFAELCAVLP